MRDPQKQDESQIALWELLTLTLDKNGERSEFLSRVEDIRKDSYILETPLRQTGSGSLSKGDDVEVSYNRKDAAYVFKASITDLFEDESESLKIKKTGDVGRMQRRRFVRLDISGKITFRVLDSRGPADSGIGNEYPGSLLNISGGGVLFEAETPLKESEVMILNFSLKGREKLENILAVVKRVESTDEPVYLVGAEFITDENLPRYGLESLKGFLPQGTGTFDENLQKLVVRFIYSQQVELRKKGLLSR